MKTQYFRIFGIIDEAGIADIGRALAVIEPTLTLGAVSLNLGIFEVRGDVAADAIIAGLDGCGYVAEPTRRRPPKVNEGQAGRVVLRALLFALAGLPIGIVAGIALGILNMSVNPECGAGSEGACAMALPEIAVGIGLIGALLGAFAGAIVGVRRLTRTMASS
jgi:hypothetical protein